MTALIASDLWNFQCFPILLCTSFSEWGWCLQKEPGEEQFLQWFGPLWIKKKSMWTGKGPHVLHNAPGTLQIFAGWMQPQRTHTTLLPSTWTDSGNLPLGPKYGQLSLSMTEFGGLALAGCHTPTKATPSPPSWTGQRKYGQDSWVKVSPNTITGKTDSHWRYWINSLLKNSQQDNEK